MRDEGSLLQAYLLVLLAVLLSYQVSQKRAWKRKEAIMAWGPVSASRVPVTLPERASDIISSRSLSLPAPSSAVLIDSTQSKPWVTSFLQHTGTVVQMDRALCGAVQPCPCPHGFSDTLFPHFSSRASPYGRSSLTSPTSAATGMGVVRGVAQSHCTLG